MEKTIYILRHGETDYNRLRKVQGSGIDTDLNDLGRAQAAAFYDRYRDLDFDLVITSMLKRTWQTVAAFREAGIPWIKDADLNEISWGVQEGKTSTPQSHQEYQQLVATWDEGNYHTRMPAGESAHELGARMEAFVHRLQAHDAQRMLVCSHGRAMRALMCVLQGKPLREMGTFQHSNTGLWVYHYADDRYMVRTENDVCHLEGLTI